MKTLLLSFLLSAASFAATGLTGNWAGSYDVVMADGQAMKGKIHLILTQTGAELTGSVGSEEHADTKIDKGRVDGDQITFESQTEGPVMKFTLKLEEDHLRGQATGDANGDTIVVKLDLTRKTE